VRLEDVLLISAVWITKDIDPRLVANATCEFHLGRLEEAPPAAEEAAGGPPLAGEGDGTQIRPPSPADGAGDPEGEARGA
jgi:hypothetical protein